MPSIEEEGWDLVIEPKKSIFSLDLKALWKYRDLLVLFVKRDFKSSYKQTVLGPLWFLIQPILTTITFLVIFGRIAKTAPQDLPAILFFMSGIVLWNYYAECLVKTSDTFVSNKGMFGKVYFPRLIVPISIVISNLVRLLIQLLLFTCFWIYFYIDGANIHINSTVLLLPFLILLMAGHGLALGIIISSMTTKYRDLKFLIQFGIQLLMYASPVVYPLSKVPEQYHWMLMLNPMTSIIETFKYSVLGQGVHEPFYLLLNFLLLCLLLFLGMLVFNKVERSFMDTV
ncbi:MAG: ABC transporter permease [Bacteroidota bacterium]|nr:ABC transporter permease [Bacteroidota bacterium]